MSLFTIGFITFKLTDLLDLILFTGLMYRLFIMLKDTRALTMFIGMFAILIMGVVAGMLNFSVITMLMQSIGTIFWLAFFILFQPELRRLLMQFGQNKFFRKLFKIEAKTIIDAIVKASFELSEKRIGGLIVLQKNVGLKNITETGIQLTSEVSSELLSTIFYPGTPLHDGAVVISNDVLLAAECILPVSQNSDIDSKYGTRHRAALGLSEESDAVIIIISEETGNVSIAYNGKLLLIENPEKLKRRIDRLFSQTRRK